MLLCADRNDRVVRYSLGATPQALAVSTYTYDSLPAAERRALPAAADVAAALDAPLRYQGQQLTLAEYIQRIARESDEQ